MGGIGSSASGSSVGDALKTTFKTAGIGSPAIITSAFNKGISGITGASGVKSATQSQLQDIRRRQENSRRQKKNILEEQLAARRARLSSMGISSEGSGQAVQKRLINNAYTDIAEDDAEYDSRYSEIYKDYQSRVRNQILNGTLDIAGKVLK